MEGGGCSEDNDKDVCEEEKKITVSMKETTGTLRGCFREPGRPGSKGQCFLLGVEGRACERSGTWAAESGKQ